MARDLRTRLAGIRSNSRPRQASMSEERRLTADPGTDSPMSGNGYIAGLPSGMHRCQRELSGWDLVSPHFWMRELSRPFSPVDLEQTIDGSPFSLRLKEARLSLSGMRFFDLETTGLSGGTGTIAFLATLGRFSGSDRFNTVQYFMDDYPGEPSMVSRLATDLSAAAVVVSYNGSSFDLPLFRTRCILNGLRPFEPLWHLDLLQAARRLWRGVLPDCSLGTVEREILSCDRGPDLPGSAIPERWFSFLRGGEGAGSAMEMVFSHNDNDVRALALLLVMMAKGFMDGRILRADPVGLASILDRSNPDLALETLETAVASGNLRAIKPLMRNYWKAGRREDRMGLIPLLPDDSYGLYMKSLHAEKVGKDLDTALSFTEKALALAEGIMVRRLEHRLRRLRRVQTVKG